MRFSLEVIRLSKHQMFSDIGHFPLWLYQAYWQRGLLNNCVTIHHTRMSFYFYKISLKILSFMKSSIINFIISLFFHSYNTISLAVDYITLNISIILYLRIGFLFWFSHWMMEIKICLLQSQNIKKIVNILIS